MKMVKKYVEYITESAVDLDEQLLDASKKSRC